jgi:hypothetical protein
MSASLPENSKFSKHILKRIVITQKKRIQRANKRVLTSLKFGIEIGAKAVAAGLVEQQS